MALLRLTPSKVSTYCHHDTPSEEEGEEGPGEKEQCTPAELPITIHLLQVQEPCPFSFFHFYMAILPYVISVN